MITLNLLPPELKESLRGHIIYASLERVMIAACSFLLIGSVLLLMIRIRLIRVLGDVQSRQLLTEEYVNVNSDVKLLNGQIARIDTLQKLQVFPSILLLDLAKRTPAGIRLTGVDFDITSESMRLLGSASQREHLLAYETALKQSPFVKSLDSPISNLFQKANITFEFKIILNVPALKAAVEHPL